MIVEASLINHVSITNMSYSRQGRKGGKVFFVPITGTVCSTGNSPSAFLLLLAVATDETINGAQFLSWGRLRKLVWYGLSQKQELQSMLHVVFGARNEGLCAVWGRVSDVAGTLCDVPVQSRCINKLEVT